MSVSLLTSGQAQLSPFTSFTTLRGSTITLDSLTVNTITAGKLLIGDDAIPDVYYFGQIPGTSIFGFARNNGAAALQASQGVLLDGSPGSSAYARESGVSPNNFFFPANTQGFSANTVTTTPDVPNTGMAQALIAFPEPIHYTATSGGDPLNPYIHASIMSAGLVLPTNVGAAGSPAAPSVAGTACVRPGIQALNPIIVVKQDANLLSASGAWFGLPLPTTGNPSGSTFIPSNANTGITPAAAASPNQFKAYTTLALDSSIYSNIRDLFCRQPPESANYLSPLQMSFFVAGCPPSTPPSAWAPPTSTLVDPSVFTFSAYPGFAGYGAGSPIPCHKFNLVFPSGITGSGITFPAASQGTSAVTTLVNANPALYPDVVYPINANTASAAVLRLSQNPNVDANGILALPPYTFTGGIWIQQIWWVQTIAGSSAIAGVYNITHLFTKAGGTGASPRNACRLEVSSRRTAGGAASDDPNGAFTVSVYLPRELSTVGRPAYASQKAVWGTDNTLRQTLPVDSTFPTTRSFGYFVLSLCCSSPTSGVNGGGLEQAPTPTACRASDNTIPPAGQAGATIPPFQTNVTQFSPTTAESQAAASLGQFSIYPPGFTDSQTAQLGAGAASTVRPYFWTSTPVAPLTPAPWYSGAPMLEGQFVLTGNV